MTKLVLIETDDSGVFWLSGHHLPREPLRPGESVSIMNHLQSEPVAFVRLCLGPRPGVSTVGPNGVLPIGSQGLAWDKAAWRIDEVTLDEILIDHRQVGCGVGSRLFMRVTNVGKVPAHFYASWECEDVQ
jgi:hypothetical protein